MRNMYFESRFFKPIIIYEPEANCERSELTLKLACNLTLNTLYIYF